MGVIRLISGFVRIIILANQKPTDDGAEGTEGPNSVETHTVRMVPQKERKGLGSVGIILEAHKLWSTHFEFFTLIQVLLILPLAILVVAFHAWELAEAPSEGESPRQPTTVSATGRSGYPNLTNGSVRDELNSALSERALLLLVYWSTVFVISIFYEVAHGLFSSAILHAVGLHYTGQSVSFVDVLRASVPRLWMRLTVTNIYSSLLSFVLSNVGFGILLLLLLYKAPTQVLVFYVGLLRLLRLVGRVVRDMVFMLARSVSVLEKDYGWAAVRRSFTLLKGRCFTALLFQLLWLFVPSFILGVLVIQFEAYISQGAGVRANLGVIQLDLAVLYILYLSYLWLLGALCSAVQYATFKAYHDEDVGESMYNLGTAKGGYKQIESTIVDERMSDTNV